MTAIHEHLERLMAQKQVAALLASIRPEAVLEEAIAIQQIPSPTFHEIARASYVLSRFGERRLQDVHIDEVFNVYGRTAGTDPARPGLLISAHTDTVFGPDTTLTLARDGDRVCGPGLGDNSLGVAALLALADALEQVNFRPACDVWWVANTREEGLGDLGGMRSVMTRLKDRLGAALVLEGMGVGRVCYGGIAVRRYKITCTGPGGHSWTNFGRPSAIHELMRLGARLADLHAPDAPRTSFNIGLIEGGTSINTIAPEASLYLDLRSEDAEALAMLERQVGAILGEMRNGDVNFTSELVGDRPVGQLPLDHWLVQGAGAALDLVGIEPSYNMASTDANAILAAGVPAVTLGITRGGDAHLTSEYIEVTPIAQGLRQAGLVAALALGRLAKP